MMKRFLPLIFALLVCLPLAGQTKKYKVQDIPNVQLQDSRRFVSNPDGILSQQAVYRIDTMLWSLRQSGRAQVAVVAVNSIGNADPFDFLMRLMSHKEGGWGVGNAAKDNGLGVLLVIDQGAIEVLTGSGLEGDLPDALVQRVINNYMLPAFRERDWDRGMVSGVEAYKSILDGVVPEDLQGGGDDWVIWIAVAFFLVIPLVVLLAAIFFSGRCPRCKKRTLKRTGSRIVNKNGRKVEQTTYVCQNCGNVVVRERDHHDGTGIGPIIGGGMIGGMGRGGGFGGGSSGGSWGGGSFGGGGGRGRF